MVQSNGLHSFFIGDNTGLEINELEMMLVGAEGELEPEGGMIVGLRGEALRSPSKDALLI